MDKLTLIELGQSDDPVYFKIGEQTQRFGLKFTAKNGVTLESASHPQSDGYVLYVKGKNVALDSEILTAPRCLYKLYLEAVAEYNGEIACRRYPIACDIITKAGECDFDCQMLIDTEHGYKCRLFKCGLEFSTGLMRADACIDYTNTRDRLKI